MVSWRCANVVHARLSITSAWAKLTCSLTCCQLTQVADLVRGVNWRLRQPSAQQAVGGWYLPSGQARSCLPPHLVHWKVMPRTRGLTVLMRTTEPCMVTSCPMWAALSSLRWVCESGRLCSRTATDPDCLRNKLAACSA